MPLETPAAVMILRSRCSHHTLRRGAGPERLEFRVARPIRGGRQSLQQASRSEHQRARAHGDRVAGRRVRGTQPFEHSRVVHQRTGADAAREDDDIGPRQFLERGVEGNAEHAVLAAYLAAPVPDERNVERGDALQHLVRPDGVESRELREKRDCDLQCGVLSLARLERCR